MHYQIFLLYWIISISSDKQAVISHLKKKFDLISPSSFYYIPLHHLKEDCLEKLPMLVVSSPPHA